MRGYFTFNGADSRDYGIYISGMKTYNGPVRSFTTIDIPGRNGALLLDNGRYDMIEHHYDAFIIRDMKNNLQDFRNFLLGETSYQRLEDSYHPDEFYLAYYNAGLENDIDGLHHTTKFSLPFMRKPQRFLKSGEEVTTLTSDGTITNPTLYASKPLLRVYGTGTIGVGSNSIRINAADGYTDIDCEIQDAFKGPVNCNGNIELLSGEFPTIPSGDVGIALTNVSKVEITPRWYRL